MFRVFSWTAHPRFLKADASLGGEVVQHLLLGEWLGLGVGPGEDAGPLEFLGLDAVLWVFEDGAQDLAGGLVGQFGLHGALELAVEAIGGTEWDAAGCQFDNFGRLGGFFWLE